MSRTFAMAGFAGALLAPTAAGQGRELYRIPNTSWSNCNFAEEIEALGDLDGDGSVDFAISDSWATSTYNGEGVVTVHSGRDGAVIRAHDGGGVGQAFGTAVASLTDRDGDGVRDYAVYAVYPQRVDFFSGIDGAQFDSWSITGKISEMESAGDLDGDGVDDLLFNGAGTSLAGRVVAYSGATQAQLWSIPGEGTLDQFGDEMVVVDDMDGDGVKELLVGAPLRPKYQAFGALYLYSMATQQRVWRVDGDPASDRYFGDSLSVAGDVDGDGTTDFTANRGLLGHSGTTDVFSGVDGSVIASLVAPGAHDLLGVGACAPFDADGDGDLDLIVGGIDTTVRTAVIPLVFAWEPRDRVFLARIEINPTGGLQKQRFLPLGDVDGDGFLDFLWASTCIDAIVRTLRNAPSITAITPDRMERASPTPITIQGGGFALAQQLAVRVGGALVADATAVDDTTITGTAPAGAAGLFDVEVTHDGGSALRADALARTPAVRVTGGFGPGDTFTIHWLCDIGDDVLAIFGAPPAVSLTTPPYEGALQIAPFDVLFLLAAYAGDEVTYDIEIPDDPAWIGTEALVQGLAGAPLFGHGKTGSWSNAVHLTVEDS